MEIAEDTKTKATKEKKSKKVKRHKGKADNLDDIQSMGDDPGDTQVRREYGR